MSDHTMFGDLASALKDVSPKAAASLNRAQKAYEDYQADEVPPTPPVVEEMPEEVSALVRHCRNIIKGRTYHAESKFPDGLDECVVWLADTLQSSQQRAELMVLEERETCAAIAHDMHAFNTEARIRARSAQRTEPGT